MRIFIPIHDTNHWYLFVVRIDNETGEYWDSLGNSAARRSNCKNILKVLDIYFGHMVTKTKKFEDFPVFKPPKCPRQEGTDDCGLHTIKNMMHYGLEWWHEFNSEQIRKELTLMLIRNQNNSRWEAMLRNIKRFQKQRQTQKKQHTETKKQSEERGKNVTKLTQVNIEPAESSHKGKQQVQGTVKPRTRKSNNRSVKRSRW
ncbi:hypothetical protein ACLB2K_008062 [Fragaria x ananassa]